MKYLVLIIVLLLAWSCLGTKGRDKAKKNDYCIQGIDSLSFNTCYVIYMYDSRGDMVALLSKKENSNQCDSYIEVGECYKIDVFVLRSTSGYTEIDYKLGQNSIYVDGFLVLSAKDQVVSSNQFVGLCYSLQ